MSFPMHPYLIGAISDAIDDRLGLIARHAALVSGGDLARQRAIQVELIQEDLGNPSPADRATIEFACDLAKAINVRWWRQGRKIVEQGQFGVEDISLGTCFIRLGEARTICPESREPLLLEGAFLSVEETGERFGASLIALHSRELKRDLRAMPLYELTKHQSSTTMFAWDEAHGRLATVFSCRKELSESEPLTQAITELWSEVFAAFKGDMVMTSAPSMR